MLTVEQVQRVLRWKYTEQIRRAILRVNDVQNVRDIEEAAKQAGVAEGLALALGTITTLAEIDLGMHADIESVDPGGVYRALLEGRTP